MLSFEAARQLVIAQTQRHLESRGESPKARPPLQQALHRILAEPIHSDRDYPPFNRSTRDGYAVRSSEAQPGAALRCVGEIKAGDTVSTPLVPNTCVQIMTGAAVPPGADAVVMLEFTERTGDNITFSRPTRPNQNVVALGSESRSGNLLLPIGTRLGFAELGLAAQVGAAELLCYQPPRVAILSTGDEVVAITETPSPFHIRNSNTISLAAQITLAGGTPVPFPNALDRVDDLSSKIETGLREPILVLSGGVSMGKYDLVESVLKSMGAEFFFDAVAIRPGKPAVFARVRDTLVFGLPGNPVSTMVTFQLFVTPAIDLLAGALQPRPLPLLEATLAEPLSENPTLTHFLPARVEWPAGESAPQTTATVRALPWHGSGDIATLSRSNCFLVVPAERPHISSGEKVSILPRLDVL